MDKRTVTDILVVILLLGAIAGLIQNYKVIKSQEYECLQSPLVYASKAFTEANNKEAWGNLYLEGIPGEVLTFNSQGITMKSVSLTGGQPGLITGQLPANFSLKLGNE